MVIDYFDKLQELINKLTIEMVTLGKLNDKENKKLNKLQEWYNNNIKEE